MSNLQLAVDVDRWVAHLSTLRDEAACRRGLEQLEAAIAQAPPRRWQHPYECADAPLFMIPNELPRRRDQADTVYREILVLLWQQYFPHYRVLLRRMAEGRESMSLETHLQYVQGNWFAAMLAHKFVEAHLSRRPHWNGLWLGVQMNQLGKSCESIAAEYALNLIGVRLSALLHGYAPAGGWRGLLWVLGLYRPRRVAAAKFPEIDEQVPFEDWICVRPRGSGIFVPVEALL